MLQMVKNTYLYELHTQILFRHPFFTNGMCKKRGVSPDQAAKGPATQGCRAQRMVDTEIPVMLDKAARLKSDMASNRKANISYI